MEKHKQSMELQVLDEEELNEVIEDINEEAVEPISPLPPYMPLRKPALKVAKDLDTIKFNVFEMLLLEEVPIEGELLAKVPHLHMEYWDLNDLEKFP